MKGTKKDYKNNLKTINKMEISTYLALNVNELNAPVKKHRVAGRYKNKTLPT